jgi:hypothetical protein
VNNESDFRGDQLGVPEEGPEKKFSTSVGSWWVSNATKYEIPTERGEERKNRRNIEERESDLFWWWWGRAE